LNFLQQKLYCPFSECIIDVTEQKTNFLKQVWGSLGNTESSDAASPSSPHAVCWLGE